MRTFNLDRLGIPGVAGLGLTLFCLSFYFGNVAPAQQSLRTLQREEAHLLQASSAQGDKATTAKPTGAIIPLPMLSDAPEFIKKLNSIADKYGIAIEHVSYRLSEKDHQRRIEVNLPLQGNYPALRFYLRDALAIAPAISLDDVNLQRSSSNEPQVEARVRLTYYLFTP